MHLVQIYTGDGKGKTTAALGLAFRAAGWGMKTLFVQFMKKWEYGELLFSRKIDEINVVQFGIERFIRKGEKPEELMNEVKRGLIFAEEEINSGKWDIVVMDEIITAILFDLVTEDEVVDFVKRNRGKCEIILTGRDATQKLIEIADLVTEMRKIKHPYDSGISARKGIEY